MPVPKKNQSRQRQQTRRANWKAKTVGLVDCPNCSAKKRPHHVCKECGYYNGKKYINVEAKAA
jgi:large subunit ribosomal protein L32